MLKATDIQGKYLEFKGRPLVRQEQEIYYGDLSDRAYVFMMIMSYKKDDRVKVQIPDKIMVQLLPTSDPTKPEKQRMASGLHDAFETACAWLNH